MIERRNDEVRVDFEAAELWAAKRRRRQPWAARLMLRKAAAACRRRAFEICDRLTSKAGTITL